MAVQLVVVKINIDYRRGLTKDSVVRACVVWLHLQHTLHCVEENLLDSCCRHEKTMSFCALQCESKKSPLRFSETFSQTDRNF